MAHTRKPLFDFDAVRIADWYYVENGQSFPICGTCLRTMRFEMGTQRFAALFVERYKLADRRPCSRCSKGVPR
jgi:hypothetical protein